MKFLGLVVVGMFLSVKSFAFILMDPDYRIGSPENVVVNLASGGCQAAGISNQELLNIISDALNNYWNTVPESRLMMKPGSESSVPVTQLPPDGQVIIGCASLGASTGGVTNVSYTASGSARIRINSDFYGANYNYESLLGVIVHELGHAVGLHHSDDGASVMTYRASSWMPGPSSLSQDDMDGVAFLYPNEKELGGLLGGCGLKVRDYAHQKNQKELTLWRQIVESLFSFTSVILFFIFSIRFFAFQARMILSRP
ncbi:MAG: matrixin family metalloprotease [Halobacteriovoraceae bacterium]|nr:matrixin family metalloprotease [Halobacteriovoraceae bacterium]MCB9095505.1 matrixin family metalloprotease [Halobacteriovoraceae bacterium]